MRGSLLKVLLVLPVCLLALASCGKQAGSEAWDPSAPDVCQLVTEQDATTALGEDPGPGVSGIPETNLPFYRCHYGPQTFAGLDVWVEPEAGELSTFLEWEQSELASGNHPGMKSLDSEGIGDAAYIFPDTDPAAQWTLVFFKDTTIVYVFVPLNGRDSGLVEQLTMDLARTIAGRM